MDKERNLLEKAEVKTLLYFESWLEERIMEETPRPQTRSSRRTFIFASLAAAGIGTWTYINLRSSPITQPTRPPAPPPPYPPLPQPDVRAGLAEVTIDYDSTITGPNWALINKTKGLVLKVTPEAINQLLANPTLGIQLPREKTAVITLVIPGEDSSNTQQISPEYQYDITYFSNSLARQQGLMPTDTIRRYPYTIGAYQRLYQVIKEENPNQYFSRKLYALGSYGLTIGLFEGFKLTSDKLAGYPTTGKLTPLQTQTISRQLPIEILSITPELLDNIHEWGRQNYPKPPS